MKKPRNATGKGYFKTAGAEPLQSMEAQVRQLTGNDLSEWLREAIAKRSRQGRIAEKLEREKQRETAKS